MSNQSRVHKIPRKAGPAPRYGPTCNKNNAGSACRCLTAELPALVERGGDTVISPCLISFIAHLDRACLWRLVGQLPGLRSIDPPLPVVGNTVTVALKLPGEVSFPESLRLDWRIQPEAVELDERGVVTDHLTLSSTRTPVKPTFLGDIQSCVKLNTRRYFYVDVRELISTPSLKPVSQYFIAALL